MCPCRGKQRSAGSDRHFYCAKLLRVSGRGCAVSASDSLSPLLPWDRVLQGTVCWGCPVPPWGWWRLPRWTPGWVGRDRGSVFVEHCVPLGCSCPSRCLSGHEKALSFHVGVLLSKVKGGFTGQAEQIADGSRHLPCQVTSI